MWLFITLITIVMIGMNHCSNIDNPYIDPNNEKINRDKSFINIGDSLFLSDSFYTTVYFDLPKLIDSVTIKLQTDNGDTVLFDTILHSNDSIHFFVPMQRPGKDTIVVEIGKIDGGVDFFQKPFVIYYNSIDKGKTFNHNDSLNLFKDVPLTLSVLELSKVDSFYLTIKADSLVLYDTSGAFDTTYAQLHIKPTGLSSYTIYGRVKNTFGAYDTVSKIFHSKIPYDISIDFSSVQPGDSTKANSNLVYVGDSLTVKYTIEKFDKVLDSCVVYINDSIVKQDSALSRDSTEYPVTSLDTLAVKIEIHDTIGNTFSKMKTFVVYDTTKPIIESVAENDTIMLDSLPYEMNVHYRLQGKISHSELTVLNSDILPVDGMVNGDTVMFMVEKLSSDTNKMRVVIRSESGNQDSRDFFMVVNNSKFLQDSIQLKDTALVFDEDSFIRLNSHDLVVGNIDKNYFRDPSVEWKFDYEKDSTMSITITVDSIKVDSENNEEDAVDSMEYFQVLEFRSAPDWFGEKSVDVYVYKNKLCLDGVQWTVTVEPVNDTPSIVFPDTLYLFDTLSLDSGYTNVDNDPVWWDFDGGENYRIHCVAAQEFILGKKRSEAKPTESLKGPVISFCDPNGTGMFTLIPKKGHENYSGSDMITFTVTDSLGAFNSKKIVIVP